MFPSVGSFSERTGFFVCKLEYKITPPASDASSAQGERFTQ
jgi:hypothetical protein